MTGNTGPTESRATAKARVPQPEPTVESFEFFFSFSLHFFRTIKSTGLDVFHSESVIFSARLTGSSSAVLLCWRDILNCLADPAEVPICQCTTYLCISLCLGTALHDKFLHYRSPCMVTMACLDPAHSGAAQPEPSHTASILSFQYLKALAQVA